MIGGIMETLFILPVAAGLLKERYLGMPTVAASAFWRMECGGARTGG